MSKHGLAKFLVGAGVGLGIGLLVAKKSGRETRHDIKVKFDELEDKIKNLDYSEVKDGVVEKLDEIRNKINDLDQEKFANLVKSKTVDIKTKLNELTKYVKKKSAPVVKKIINDINKKLDSLQEPCEE